MKILSVSMALRSLAKAVEGESRFIILQINLEPIHKQPCRLYE